MTDTQWEHVADLVERAQRVPAEERAELLEAGCTDEAVRREAASLLAAYDDADGLIDDLAGAVIPCVLDGELEAPQPEAAASNGADPLALVGQPVTRYVVDTYLGGGGMGVVYRARDTRLGRTVALKFLPPHVSVSPEATQRFVREARAASLLDHPNIATVHEIDATADGRRFIAMAYYDGETLADTIERGPVPVEGAMDYALQVAEGLAQAHEAGIVHRDVKPANVMVTERGEVKLLDFGLARIADESSLTRTGTRMGTAAYMSPEQARGEAVDARTDLWALGAVLYELLTGTRPFQGGRDASTVYAILHEEPAPLCTHRPGIPAGLKHVVTRLLTKDKDARYASAPQVIEDLRALRADAETVFPSPKGSPASAPGRLYRVWTAATRSRAASILSGVAVLLLLAALAVGVPRFGTSAPAPPVRTLAVLPFDDRSASEQDGAFADRITDGVRARLGQIGALRVTARRSTAPYRATDKAPSVIATELGADYLLDGSVQQAGGRMQITARLVDPATDAPVWTARYDRPPEDLFAVQSEMVTAIAAALETPVGTAVEERIERPPTTDFTAYEFFLRGREYIQRGSKDDNETGIRLLRQALARDPDFALARARLARAYALDAWVYGAEASRADSAVAEAERAVTLAPDLPDAHAALGFAHMRAGRFSEARASLERVLDLNPNDWSAVSDLGIIHLQTGRLAEAIALWEQAVKGNPAGARGYRFNLALAYRILGLLNQAEQANHAALTLDPDHVLAIVNQAHVDLFQGETDAPIEATERLVADYDANPYALQSAGWIHILAGEPERAIAPLERAYALSPTASGEGYVRVRLGYALWQSGDRDRALQLFDAFDRFASDQIEKGNEYGMLRYSLAAAHAVRGHTDQALRWLDQAVHLGWPYELTMIHDPLLSSLRETTQFQALVAQVQERNQEMRRQIAQAGERAP
jgi:TolB-like protein/predicted Zn-dependent protease/predicted Ser/Thr protein kinase